MIIRLLPLPLVLIVTALLGTGCSLHDKPRAVAHAESRTGSAEPVEVLRPASRRDLARDASRALRQPASKPEDAPDIWTRARLGFAMTENLHHPRVEVYKRHYRQHPNIISIASARAEPFAYFILTEIERRGLPGELLLLPIVESGYAPEATSSGSAAGIWQFIPATGEHFGLIQDDWYDGRRDVYQSTHAALDYLEHLHARFGDWYLALAAYNYGQGNVARAMAANAAAGRPTDYWSLRLSSEAMSYVPRLLALRALIDEPERHGVRIPVIANKPYLRPVNPGRQADLEYIAELAGAEFTEIARLNPGYHRTVTHPYAAQHLLLPASAATALETSLRERGPDHALVPYAEYEVRAGDNLGAIARRHGTGVAELRGMNGLDGDLIRAGQRLRVPVTGRAIPGRNAAPPPSTQPLEYTVQAGDSLWTIARRHEVGVSGLRKTNGLSRDTLLQPGQVLALPRAAVDPDTTRMEYRIRPGDSLGAISRRFDVEIQDLRRWNSLNGDGIRAGDTLTLYVARNVAAGDG
ncbi:MAG: LysM peptidoglycan-binding domain-containing protein [Thioalkalivibrio sp.]|nr:LysM peptidoglycan-binding domain-containing protein [Thioalkalivibrio sp.]